MADVRITALPAAQTITGTELVPVVQNGLTVQTTVSAITASPSLTQTFLTVGLQTGLPNSRYFSTGVGLGITDGGAQAPYTIALNGTSASLESASNGVIVKTAPNTIAARTLGTSGNGIGVTNGDGIAGNPTFALTGLAQALANATGTGMLALGSSSTISPVTITGVTNQTSVINGDGSGNPTIGLASNPVIPGTAAVTIPIGTTAQRSVGANGEVRFNSDLVTYEAFAGGAWQQFSLSGGVTTVSAGSTGFAPSTPTAGAITLSGILNSTSGGTGASALTGYLFGNGASPATASTTIPNTNITGLGTMSTQNASAVAITGGTINGTTVGATTPATVAATQVDITAQGDLRLQDTTGGEYVAIQAPATLAASYTLTMPADDGTAGQALVTDGSGVLSWSTAASGDVYGPASATDNAIARFDLTTGKIIQNSVVTIADTTGDMAGVGTFSSGAITSSALTSGRVPYAGTAGLIQDAAGLTFDGSTLSNTGRITTGTGVGAGSSATQITIGGTLVSASNVTRAVSNIGTAPSTSTTEFSSYLSAPSTTAAAYTITTLNHFIASFATLGATSAITNQFGHVAASTLTNATNNYGFYGNIASGTGRFNFYANGTAANVFAGTTSLGGIVGAESLRVTPVASSVNYYNMQGNTTGNTPQLSVQGSDTNIQFAVSSKGSGQVRFFTNAFGQEQFAITHTASAVNYLQVTGGATGGSPTISSQGSDTNISLTLTAKGTGKVISTTDATINGATVGKGGGSQSNNTAVGSGALALNTTGNQNTGVGFNALYFTNTGIFNTAVGTSALTCNTVASSQTAVGYQALINATTAVATFGAITAGSGYTNGTYTAVAMTPVSGATFITYPTVTVVVAGGVVTTVTLVTGGIIASSTAATVLTVAAALLGGTGSGFSISVATFVTGASNTAVGYQTLTANTAGSNNTALGFQAGNTLVSGGNNLILGNGAAVSTTTVSNEITLGNSSITAFRIPGLTITAGAKYMNFGSSTVALLAAAATAGLGARAFVTDALAPSFGVAVTGGGAVAVPVYSNGTTWLVG